MPPLLARALAVALVALAPLASGSPLLVAVVPDLPGPGPGDEGVAIATAARIDLSGWSIADNNGAYVFPAGTTLDAGALAWVTGNQTSWTTYGGPAARPWSSGGPRLANDGDQVYLRDPAGRTVDAMRWGNGTGVDVTSAGLVLRRDRLGDAWLDTDQDSDWVTPRMHRIGESDLQPRTFAVQQLTLYASPDASFATLTGLIAAATDRLHLHVYGLRSIALVDALLDAKAEHPDLQLTVLAEGGPVGMTASERHLTADALRRIQDAGGFVRLAGNGRYDYHHLKVLVADDAVAIQSENWVASGVPEDPTWGNRGWGVVVHDATVADWFDAWMADDHLAWDAQPFALGVFDPLYTPPARLAPRTGGYGPVQPGLMLRGSFEVTPLVSPDHTQDPRADPLAALLGGARQAVRAQQLDLATGAANRLGWGSADPLLAGLQAAAAGGVDTRVLAAAPFGSDAGNQPALDALAASGAQAATLDRPGLAVLHNKGLIVDDVVVVGSMNGNHHSRSANREVSIVLRGPGIAQYYGALFDADWEHHTAGPDLGVVGTDVAAVPSAAWPTLLAAVGLAARWTSRRGPGLRSPSWPSLSLRP